MVSISLQSMADEIRRQQKLSQSIAQDQRAVSTGTRLTQPSQDPQAWVQISEIGRGQAQQQAWLDNVGFGTTRAKKAQANLDEINLQFSRARELLVQASTGSLDAAGKAAIVTSLQSLRGVVGDLLDEKDYQGVPVFDDTVSTKVPVSRGLTLDVVAIRQSVAEGVDVNGTPMTLDAILAQAVAAVQSGTDTDRQNALTAVEKGLDHVILNQSVQGIRTDRLETVSNRLRDLGVSLSERRSKLEDTDLTSTLAGLQSKLLTLEAAQAAFTRINRQSLWDLLR